jgi:C-terminal processing protease CtpA/Prc
MHIDDQKQFAKALTNELQAVTDDKHIIVWYSEAPNAKNSQPTAAQIAAANRFFRYVDYGYNGSARLAGNIGYVALGGFADLPKAKSTIDAAMSLVNPTEALIVDMRGNGGGDSDTVNYLLAYFFSRPVEATTAIQRTGGKLVTHRNFTPAKLGGPRYSNKPVYVLVDHGTISGGELFAYNIQALHRASIIGEVTAGAANGLGAPPYYLSDHLSISLPDTMLRNPYTGTNWEGVGVEPDVTIDGKGALLTAYQRALEGINASYDPLGELNQARKNPAAALSKSFPRI